MPREPAHASEGSDPETASGSDDGTTRRGLLRGAAAVGVLGGAGLGVAALQADQAVPTILLGGEVPGWSGVAPGSIADRTNPTLNLVPDRTYRLAWMNLDGQPHDVTIEDANGTQLEVLFPVEMDSGTFDQLANATMANATVDNFTLANLTANATVDAAGNVTEPTGNVTEPTGNATGNATAGAGQQPIPVSETVSEQGAVQAVEFTATPEMAAYRCTIHPTTMVGDVSVGGDGM